MKTDTLREVMPSCVSCTRRQSIKVGESAYNDMKQDKRRATRSWKRTDSNTFIEFKRTMGTDTVYHSEYMQHDYTSTELSAEVLKALKSYVTDEQPESIVVTVPAKFTVNQKTATLQAARLAGFSHCELLQEPIAAAMAYGLSTRQKDGHWLVFDFGGGTFDSALLKVEDGIIQVLDTEGDNYLGGKNLDYAIVDHIILPHIGSNYAISNILADPQKKEVLRDALKTYAEDLKIQLSIKPSEDVLSNLGDLGDDDDGEEIEIDLTVSQADMNNVIRPYFQKSVDICLTLLQRNHIHPDMLGKIILVGGPTQLPLIRTMLQKQVAPVVDTTINPMTAIAVGAALYASTIDAPAPEKTSESADMLQLQVGYEATTVELVDWVSIKLQSPSRNPIFAELTRGDKAWSSGKTQIDDRGRVFTVNLLPNKPNAFTIHTYDHKGNSLPCFPSEFVIIQGTKVGRAVLPYHIGISVWNEQKSAGIFMPLVGLEKNKPLPSIGVVRNRHTTSPLRPGISTDMVKIPVYQADEYKENARAYLYEWVSDVVVTGDEVAQLIPQGSIVEVTLKVDTSEQMLLEVYFPETDQTIEKPLDTQHVQSLEEANARIVTDLAAAYDSLYQLSQSGINTLHLRKLLGEVEEEHRNSNEKKAVLQHLKEVLRKIESFEGVSEWERTNQLLRAAMSDLKRIQQDFGTEHSQLKVNELEVYVYDVIRQQDVRAGQQLLKMIKVQENNIMRLQRYINWIVYLEAKFDAQKWTDKGRARTLLDKAEKLIDANPTAEMLHPYVDTLLDMRIEDETEENKNSQSKNTTDEPSHHHNNLLS